MLDPCDNLAQSPGQEWDIKSFAWGRIFSGGQQVEEERSKPLLGEPISDVAVAWTLASAPTPVGKNNNTAPSSGGGEVPDELDFG
jgi:hypothetical protein